MKNNIIVFSGIDGSGKTTIINELQKRLEGQGKSTNVVWMRYCHYLTRSVFLLARLTGHTVYEFHNGEKIIGYHDFYRSKVISYLFIGTLILDTFFASILKIYIPLYLSKKTIICDRWIPDILIDIEIDTNINCFYNCLVAKLFLKIMPKNTLLFKVIREKTDTINARRENTYDKNFTKRYNLYNEIQLSNELHTIHNNQEIKNIVDEIIPFIYSELSI